MKKIVLIPSYEPDEELIKLINNLKKENVDIIVVNDGSSGEYNKIFDKIQNDVKLISYKKNCGKGYALKTGLKYIKENYENDYAIVTMDSDGQHTIKDAMKLCSFIEENPDKLVLGKRLREKKIPLRSKIGNEITKWIYKKVTKVSVYDTQTGLRAFSNKLIDFMINIEGNRFEYEMNVILKSPYKGIKI